MSEPARLPWWVLAIVIAGAVLLSIGAVVALAKPAMLAPPGEPINGAVHVYAGYLFSRNLAVAAFLLGALLAGARRMLGTMLALSGFIQLLDAGMDAVEGRWVLVPGILVLAALFLLAAVRSARTA